MIPYKTFFFFFRRSNSSPPLSRPPPPPFRVCVYYCPYRSTWKRRRRTCTTSRTALGRTATCLESVTTAAGATWTAPPARASSGKRRCREYDVSGIQLHLSCDWLGRGKSDKFVSRERTLAYFEGMLIKRYWYILWETRFDIAQRSASYFKDNPKLFPYGGGCHNHRTLSPPAPFFWGGFISAGRKDRLFVPRNKPLLFFLVLVIFIKRDQVIHH